MNNTEQWKDISGFDGLYQISNFGRIKSVPRNTKNQFSGKERIIKTFNSKFGYEITHLSKNNKHYNVKIHQLVAEAFIPNPDNKPQINHIDGNKLNNNVSNLEWCTAQENVIHAYKNKLIIHYSQKIVQFDKNNNFIKEWNSISEANKYYNISNGKISAVCKGKRKTAGGFIWKYKEGSGV